MVDTRCKHCGEPIFEWRGPAGTWKFAQWRHKGFMTARCRLSATPRNDLAESAQNTMFTALDDFDNYLAAKHHYPRCQNENCPNGDTCPFRHCAACGPASRWPCRYAKEQQ